VKARNVKLTAADHGPLDPAIVAALYAEHADELRRFVVGVVRDATLAQDVLQTTFVKLVEQGSGTRSESRKAWLFRVAFHEALDAKRRIARKDNALRRAAEQDRPPPLPPDAGVLRLEVVEAVREALRELPPDQQEVVRLRIYEEKTFAEIARLLSIPLGTALGRMNLAVRKLRDKLDRST